MKTSNLTLTWNEPRSWEQNAVNGWDDVQKKSVVLVVRTVTHWATEVVDHGLKDNKGRAIGNYAVIEGMQKVVKGRDELEPNMTYFVRTQATRNGSTFGSGWSNGTECSSLEEAKALAAKKIAAAGKRFARAVAKGEGKQFAAKVSS